MVGNSADLDIVHKRVVADFEGDAVKRRWVPDRECVLVAHLQAGAFVQSAAASLLTRCAMAAQGPTNGEMYTGCTSALIGSFSSLVCTSLPSVSTMIATEYLHTSRSKHFTQLRHKYNSSPSQIPVSDVAKWRRRTPCSC